MRFLLDENFPLSLIHALRAEGLTADHIITLGWRGASDNLIVDHLTEHGVMSASLLYESPFTDVTPRGPDGLFTSPQLHELLAILDEVRSAALAA